MDDQRPARASSVVIIVVAVVAILTAYTAVYFALSTRGMFNDGQGTVHEIRRFHYKWEAILFTPAASIESLITGKKIENSYNSFQPHSIKHLYEHVS